MSGAIDWDLGISLLSQYDVDGFLEAQVDAFGEQNSGLHAYELHHPYGFEGRPFDAPTDANNTPDPTQASQLFYGLEGGKGHALALENPSVVQKLPALKKGETLMYGGQGQFWRMMADGSIGVWAPADDGGIDFSGNLGPDGVFFTGRWGTLELSDNGFHVKHSSGARFDLGAIGGLPAPLNAIGSYAKVTAGTVDLEGAATTLGQPDPTGVKPYVSLANAQQLAIMLGNVLFALQSVTRCLATGANGGGTVVFAGLPTLTAAVAACNDLGSALLSLATGAKAAS